MGILSYLFSKKNMKHVSSCKESYTGYVEDSDGKVISRTDTKSFTDDDAKFLMQQGYEKALGENYNGQMLDFSIQEEKDRNKKEYTTILPVSDFINIEPQASALTSTDIFFLSNINGHSVTKPDIPQYWYYDYNIHYSKEIIKLIQNELLVIGEKDLEKRTISELKPLLSNYGLSVTGKKDILVKRIRDNISIDDIRLFFNEEEQFFQATANGKSLINTYIESATKNLELEDKCIEYIIKEDYKKAYNCIFNYIQTTPNGIGKSYLFHEKFEQNFHEIMCNKKFFYTLSKDREIEAQIRAAIIFCNMYGLGQDNIRKLIKRIYRINNIVFSDDAKNIIDGRLL